MLISEHAKARGSRIQWPNRVVPLCVLQDQETGSNNVAVRWPSKLSTYSVSVHDTGNHKHTRRYLLGLSAARFVTWHICPFPLPPCTIATHCFTPVLAKSHTRQGSQVSFILIFHKYLYAALLLSSQPSLPPLLISQHLPHVTPSYAISATIIWKAMLLNLTLNLKTQQANKCTNATPNPKPKHCTGVTQQRRCCGVTHHNDSYSYFDIAFPAQTGI